MGDLDVDDVVQEAYAKLVALESVDEIRRPKSYFFQTAYSVLVSHIRRSRVVSIQSIGNLELLGVPADDPLPDRRLVAREQLQEIAEAISSMPATCREVFILRRVHGLSQRVVAARLGISENTVEHHMTRGIRLLMDSFGRGGKLKSRSSIGQDETASSRNEQAGNE